MTGRVAGGSTPPARSSSRRVLGFVAAGFGVLAGTLLTVVAAVAPLFW
ncbi:MAG TPA: hypothetical protein VFZ32_07015 [Micromonosporaceae bacterium]